jgi:dephospho-CoA kinase
MRRAINTIPKQEYDDLMKDAALRMHRKIQRLADEEISKMREADNKGNFEKAEVHDFNSRALSHMADMYYEIIKKEKDE